MYPYNPLFMASKLYFFSFQFLLVILLSSSIHAQVLQDDFEGNGNINSWYGDDCQINTAFANPVKNSLNPSPQVLKYEDIGGQYANVRFDVGHQLDLSTYSSFMLKIYVPSSSISGNQPNQISLKLQDSRLGSPWSTQTEIIKPITPDQWQTVTFDFASDPYINLDPNSPPPTQRTDLNRVLLQVNGENNTDIVTAYIDDFYYFDTTSAPTVYTYDQLVWADEFNGNGAIDTSKWFHQTQLPNGGSWYNGEIQHYTDRTDNSYQSGGSLHLVAKKESFSDQGYTKQYTSARLNSKMAFTYGRVVIRAKLPYGVGTWPAIWMLGKNINEDGAYWDNQGYGTTYWPACGETDIMEHWGDDQNFVQSAMHTPSSHGGTVNKGGQTIPTASTQFHTYEVKWTPTKMIFSVDSVVHYTYQPTTRDANTWPFDDPQYLLLNIAIQPSIDPNFTESEMEIDYLRVYQSSSVGVNEVEEPQRQPKLYPNPVKDTFRVDFDETTNSGTVQVDIYNLSGKLLKSKSTELDGQHVEVSGLNDYPAGVYLAQLQCGSKTHYLKFLKH